MAEHLLVGEIHDDLGNMNRIYGVKDTPKVPFRDAIAAPCLSGLEGAVFLGQPIWCGEPRR